MGWSVTELHQQGNTESKDFELVKARARHFEHVFKETVLQSFELIAGCDSLKCQISMFSFDFDTSTMIKL